MYLWLMIDRLWVLFPIFLARSTNINIEKDLSSFWDGNNGQNSDDQAEDVSDDFILANTYWVIPWVYGLLKGLIWISCWDDQWLWKFHWS